MGLVKNCQYHRSISSLALPYQSFTSPESTQPAFVTGSTDILTSAAGFAARRPGFSSTLEVSPTIFNDCQRVFTWNRFDGTFVQMACDINSSNQAVVYKRVVGQDDSFTSIFTDTSSSTPFSFTVSNNTVYFSNGNVAKKYDPLNGVTNWGISAGSNAANIVGPDTAGAGANNGNNSNAWINPGNVTSATNFADSNLAGAPDISDNLKATQFGFGVSSSETITGLQISFDALVDNDPGPGLSILHVGNIKGGVFTGIGKDIEIRNTIVHTFSIGGSSDLWGTTWTANDINQTSFGAFFGWTNNDTTPNTCHIRNVQITVFGVGGPTVTLTGTGLTATTGYQYVTCYGNSNSGHISSPSSPSAVVKPSNQSMQITLQASNDPQVNQIRVFRSTDSVPAGANAGVYFEIPTSPYTNTNQNVIDAAADGTLNINNIAPIPGTNDPPTPGMCPVYFSGRIWLFKNNQLFFSGLEEISNGVPEESFPSGVAGNFINFDQPITGLAVCGTGSNQTLLVFCSGRIYGIAGNSQATFRRFLLSNRRGVTSYTNIDALGGSVAWLDTSTQVWFTDGTSFIEVGLPIRTDLKQITDQSGCSLSFHAAGEAHWLVVSTGTKLFVGDMDTQFWMPPWTFSCTYIRSMEVSSGNYMLAAVTPTKILTLNQSGIVGSFNDNGSTYQPVGRLSLQPLVPDYSNFSVAYGEMASQPSRTGIGSVFQVNTNNNSLSDFSVMVDDDPLLSSTPYTSITANLATPQTAFNRGQGTNIVQNIYTANKEAEGRWVGLQFKGEQADDNLKIYSAFIGFKELGR